jgi:hypothetical protein
MKSKKNTQELVNIIPQELMKIYEFNLPSMKANLKENGMLSPVVLSKLGIPIDGYTRLLAALELGSDFTEVPVIQTDLEATEENRVALNQHGRTNAAIISCRLRHLASNKEKSMGKDITVMLKSIQELEVNSKTLKP